MNNWKEIWNDKGRINNSIILTLLNADGYDIPWSRIGAEEWFQYCNNFYSKIGISMDDTILRLVAVVVHSYTLFI